MPSRVLSLYPVELRGNMEISDERSRTGTRETELRVEHSRRRSPGVVAFALCWEAGKGRVLRYLL